MVLSCLVFCRPPPPQKIEVQKNLKVRHRILHAVIILRFFNLHQIQGPRLKFPALPVGWKNMLVCTFMNNTVCTWNRIVFIEAAAGNDNRINVNRLDDRGGGVSIYSPLIPFFGSFLFSPPFTPQPPTPFQIPSITQRFQGTLHYTTFHSGHPIPIFTNTPFRFADVCYCTIIHLQWWRLRRNGTNSFPFRLFSIPRPALHSWSQLWSQEIQITSIPSTIEILELRSHSMRAVSLMVVIKSFLSTEKWSAKRKHFKQNYPCGAKLVPCHLLHKSQVRRTDRRFT